MKARKFNNHLMPDINEKWAARILGMAMNPGNGPDLIDDEKAVEIKFTLIYPTKYRHKSWRILAYQCRYNEEYPEIYWGLGFYTLSQEIKKIPETAILEEKVLSRELYLVRWNWMEQFPVYCETGRTRISEWENYLIFAKAKLIPKVTEECKVEKGKLFFTEGVSPEKFKINTKPL